MKLDTILEKSYLIRAILLSVNWSAGGEHMALPVRPVAGSVVLGLITAVGGLLVTVASFYLILKIAGLVDALRDKVKEMKV